MRLVTTGKCMNPRNVRFIRFFEGKRNENRRPPANLDRNGDAGGFPDLEALVE